MEGKIEEEIDELQDAQPVEFSFVVEEGKIQEFADAIFDTNDIFREEEAAQEEGFNAIPAPITFVETHRFERARQPDFEPDEYFDEQLALHGAQEYEIHRMPTAGDTLHAKRELEEVFTKDGSSGELRFGIFKTEYTDDDGGDVITTRKTRVIVGEEQ